MISIDFEYCSEPKDWGLDEPYKDKPYAVKLFCVSICNEIGTRSWWLQDQEQRDDFIKWFDMNETYLAHAYEIAEAKCLAQLGIDPGLVNFYDTWTISMLLNDTREEASLVNMCKKFLGVNIDADIKELMRSHCIKDETKGHEEEIMRYCESDTVYLKPLLEKLAAVYNYRLSLSNCISLGTGLDYSFIDFIESTSNDIRASMIISKRGIPVDSEYMKRLQSAMIQFKNDYIQEMNSRFNCFKLKKDGTYSEDQAVIQELLKKEVPPNWEKTASGKLSTASETLKELFDCHRPDKRFGEWLFYWKEKVQPASKGIADGSWLTSLRGDRMYVSTLQPLKSKTHRWQGRSKEGYVPLWTGWTRAAIDPPEGWYAIECDYHSEETAIYGVIFNDPKYLEQYRSGDAYCYNAINMGLLPKECVSKKKCVTLDQQNMRSTIKTFTLAWQYGCGVKKLSVMSKLDMDRTKDYKKRLEDVYSESMKSKRVIGEQLGDNGTLVFPDGYPICYSNQYGHTTKLNAPIQGFGAYILRVVVQRALKAGFKIFATVHDALWILTQDVNDGQRLKKLMEDTARELLQDDTLEVGEPFILSHGDHKCEDSEDTKIWKKYVGD